MLGALSQVLRSSNDEGDQTNMELSFSECSGFRYESLKEKLGGKMTPSWEILQMTSIITALC